MHEDIVPGLPADKAKALCIIKPLHCSLFHFIPVSIFEFLLRRVAASEEDDAIAEPTSNADESKKLISIGRSKRQKDSCAVSELSPIRLSVFECETPGPELLRIQRRADGGGSLRRG